MLDIERIRAVEQGREVDPFAVLGFHRGFARLFEPRAERVFLLADGLSIPMARIGAEGLFEAAVKDTEYKYLVEYRDGRQEIRSDAYNLPPVIGEMDEHLFLRAEHFELFRKLGSHVTDAGTSFAVWAPSAMRVSVVGDFNGWDGRINPMRRHPVSGIWDMVIPGLPEGSAYKYEILDRNGKVLPLKSDPFAFECELRPKTASVTARHMPRFETARVKSDIRAPMSIYEVHPGSWRRRPDGSFLNYRELASELVPYAKDMGFTHIELTPVTEYPYDGSWGYQPTGMFAPTSRYGGREDFRAFVETAHAAGVGVIIDWVGAHFPKDAHGLADFDGRPEYEYADSRKGEHRDWGTKIYDFGKNEVVNFLISSAQFWCETYGVDGLRFDAVASMLYLDYSRRDGNWVPNRFGGVENLEAIGFIRKINSVLYRDFPGIATFAEESTGFPRVSAPVDAGGLGFGYKWNMGWMHDVLSYMARDSVHRRYHHHEIAHTMDYAFAENFVLSVSHDEVVHCKSSLLMKMPGGMWQKLANLRAFYGLMWTMPGRKLLFMGGEFAQQREWSEDRALDWDLLEGVPHRGVKKLVRDLNLLYRAEPDLHENDSSASSFTWINRADTDNSVFSYMRGSLAVVANMTAIVRENYRLGVPEPGGFAEILNTDSFGYGGSGVRNPRLESEPVPSDGMAQSLLLTLPPLSVVVLKKAPGGAIA
ncbi:MAG: 1,4-alpha-glucan branching protein GlgB [Rickettsiales bacterium]|jgi:1,4-alpha-glucan branching enzyme|nr:1,4-alpha-glucan branching protein GlgB [Rickettsiales bacterium]